MAVIYPEVSMPLPNPFRRLKADTSTVDELSAELGRQDRIRLDAQNALHDLGAKRPGLLIDGSDADLAKHDAAMAAARRSQEQAEARIAAVEPEWRAADQRETAARLDRDRRDRYAAASKARAEGVKVLAEYDKAAAALAGKLHRLAEIGREIDAANADLPDDYPPIPDSEPFNGRLDVPDRWGTHDIWVDPNGDSRGHAAPGAKPPFPGCHRQTVSDLAPTPGVPGYLHRPLAGRVVLPAVDPTAAPFWAPGVSSGPPTLDARAAFLRLRGINP